MTAPKKKGPPGLAEDPAQLRREAEAIDGKRKRGRPRKTPEPASEPAPAGEIEYPREALTQLHAGLWRAIAKALKSKYVLSPQGADEMATYADLCLRQYVSPFLAQHVPLAMWSLCQFAALGTCLAMMEPKRKAAEGPTAQPEPSSALPPDRSVIGDQPTH